MASLYVQVGHFLINAGSNQPIILPYAMILRIIYIMQSEGQVFDLKFFLFICSGLLLIFLFINIRSNKTHRRLQKKKSEVKKMEQTDKNVIIVAFEILNFIVSFSDKHKNRYRPIQSEEQSFVKKMWNYVTNTQPCYRQRFHRKSIAKFFSSLLTISNLKIVLYTKLQKQKCDKILNNLKILNYFEKNARIYTEQDFKRVDQIDHDTGRVIIISANKQDQDFELTEHHTLILDLQQEDEGYLDDKILNGLSQSLGKLAQKGRVDTLHQDMHKVMWANGVPLQTEQN